MKEAKIKQQKASTLKDVALAAGVSMQAVSLVLRGKGEGQISKRNSEKILRVAQQLNFRRNDNACRIRYSCSGALTLVTDDQNNKTVRYFDFQGDDNYALTLQGIISVAAESGIDIKLLPLPTSMQNHSDYIRNNIGYPYSDGVLFYGYYYLKDIYSFFQQQSLPCLGMVRFSSMDVKLPYVGFDYRTGYQLLIDYMHKRGCRHFVFGGFAMDHAGYRKRRELVRQIVRESGFADSIDSIITPDIPSLRKAVKVFLGQWKKGGSRPTAILCFTPRLAGCWQYELEAEEVAVGEKIVVGCLEDSIAYPAIPSVHLPSVELGCVATRLIIEAVTGKKMPDRKPVLLTPGLNLPE